MRHAAAPRGIDVRLLTPADAPAYRDLMLHAYAAALHLYRTCGFREWGLEPKAVRLPAGFKAKVHMTCDLASP